MRLVALFLLVSACGTTEPEPSVTVAAEEPRIPAIGERSVDVVVNGQKVTTLREERLRVGVRLDELLTAHAYVLWTSVRAYGPGVGPIEWIDPSSSFAGLVPEAYLDADRGAVALVEPGSAPATADPMLSAIGIDEIHIDVMPRPRTARELLADGCAELEKGERGRAATPRRWRGPSYNFSNPTHWSNTLDVDLGEGRAGGHAGTLRAYTAERGGFRCVSQLYRLGERRGRLWFKAIHDPGEPCANGTIELACRGSDLELWWYRVDGTYFEHGVLSTAP